MSEDMDSAAAPAGKVQENRIRRAAERQGLRVVKSRRRDPRATDFGRFWIFDSGSRLVLGKNSGATADEVEAFLLKGPRA